MPDFMQLRHFKGMVKVKEPPGPVVLRKQSISAIESAADSRQVRFCISTGAVDREKDTVAINGWETDAFLRNPVVLWGHKSSELPIGRCIDLSNDGTALRAMVEFVPADMPEVGPRAEAVLRMCRTGFLSATSVGFRPLEYKVAEDRDDGESWWPPFDFLKQELMEFSIVSIPANPEALIDESERTFVSMLATPQPTAEEIAAGVQAAADGARAAEEASALVEAERVAAVTAARKRRQLEARLVEIGN